MFKLCQKCKCLQSQPKGTDQLDRYILCTENICYSQKLNGRFESSLNKMQASNCEVEATLQCNVANIKP